MHNKLFCLSDVGIVIQGPTTYYKEILNNLDYQFDYIWSTWDDEPVENLIEINKKIKLVISKKPNYPGVSNINLQCKSSEEGIKLLNKPWIIKIRSDLIWFGQEELITKVFNKIIENNSFAAFFNYKPTIKEIHDFICFGSKENLIKIWSYRQLDFIHRSPENQLVNHLMKLLNLDYDAMVKRMSFVNVLMEENKLDFICLKYYTATYTTLCNQCNSDLFGVPSYPKKIDS